MHLSVGTPARQPTATLPSTRPAPWVIPTTPKEAYRTVISIQYRERLCQELPYLKQRLYHYAQEQGGTAYLAGYEVQADRGELRILELETPDWHQLRLALDDDHSESAL